MAWDGMHLSLTYRPPRWLIVVILAIDAREKGEWRIRDFFSCTSF